MTETLGQGLEARDKVWVRQVNLRQFTISPRHRKVAPTFQRPSSDAQINRHSPVRRQLHSLQPKLFRFRGDVLHHLQKYSQSLLSYLSVLLQPQGPYPAHRFQRASVRTRLVFRVRRCLYRSSIIMGSSPVKCEMVRSRWRSS